MRRLLKALTQEPCARQLLQQVAAPGAVTTSCTSVSSSTACFSSHAGSGVSSRLQLFADMSAASHCSRQHQRDLHGQAWGGHATTSSSSSSSSSSLAGATLGCSLRALVNSSAAVPPAAGFHTSTAPAAAAKRSSAASKARSKSKPKGSAASRAGPSKQQQQQLVRKSRLPTDQGVTYLPKPARLLLRVVQQQAVHHDSPHLYRIARQWHPYTFNSYGLFRTALRQLKQLQLVTTQRPPQLTPGNPDRWVWAATPVGAAVALPPSEFQQRVEQRVAELQEAVAAAAEAAAQQQAAQAGAIVPVQAA